LKNIPEVFSAKYVERLKSYSPVYCAADTKSDSGISIPSSTQPGLPYNGGPGGPKVFNTASSTSNGDGMMSVGGAAQPQMEMTLEEAVRFIEILGIPPIHLEDKDKTTEEAITMALLQRAENPDRVKFLIKVPPGLMGYNSTNDLLQFLQKHSIYNKSGHELTAPLAGIRA